MSSFLVLYVEDVLPGGLGCLLRIDWIRVFERKEMEYIQERHLDCALHFFFVQPLVHNISVGHETCSLIKQVVVQIEESTIENALISQRAKHFLINFHQVLLDHILGCRELRAGEDVVK